MTQVTAIRDPKPCLSFKQVERLLAFATNPSGILPVHIPWHSITRVGDLARIRIQDIDIGNLAAFRKTRNNESLY